MCCESRGRFKSYAKEDNTPPRKNKYEKIVFPENKTTHWANNRASAHMVADMDEAVRILPPAAVLLVRLRTHQSY